MTIKKCWATITSLRLTVVTFVLLMVLIFMGTLDQVEYGIYYVQKLYFHRWFLWWHITQNVAVPFFPGGFLVGTVMIMNLFSASIKHRLYRRKKWALGMMHLGVIILIVGGGLSSVVSVESQMVLAEGETKSYTEHRHRIEFAITDTSHPEKDVVISIPKRVLEKQTEITHDKLPFKINVVAFFANAKLVQYPTPPKHTTTLRANKGLGARILAQPIPPVYKDDQINHETAFIEIIGRDKKALGTWLVSRVLPSPQAITIGGKRFTFEIRAKRYHLPYSITLKDFIHERYEGTNTPKRFESSIYLEDRQKNLFKDQRIYMNHPLRYKGKTFYQASFAENDTISVLQVVENPSWLLPYLSSLLMCLGLLIYFLQKMRKKS